MYFQKIKLHKVLTAQQLEETLKNFPSFPVSEILGSSYADFFPHEYGIKYKELFDFLVSIKADIYGVSHWTRQNIHTCYPSYSEYWQDGRLVSENEYDYKKSRYLN